MSHYAQLPRASQLTNWKADEHVRRPVEPVRHLDIVRRSDRLVGIVVRGFELRDGDEEGEGAYVVYILGSKREGKGEEGETVRRRFSSLAALAEDLALAHSLQLPFPPRLLLLETDPSICAERVGAIQTFFNQLFSRLADVRARAQQGGGGGAVVPGSSVLTVDGDAVLDHLECFLAPSAEDEDASDALADGIVPGSGSNRFALGLRHRMSMRVGGSSARHGVSSRGGGADSVRASTRVIEGFDEKEIGKMRDFLVAKGESEPTYVGTVYIDKGGKEKRRVLVITVNKVYLFKEGCEKVEHDAHLIELAQLYSPMPNEIELTFKSGTVVDFSARTPHDGTLIIQALRVAEDILFPGREKNQRIALDVEPKKERLPHLPPYNHGPCGGFSTTFRSMVLYCRERFGVVEEEIAFVVDSIFEQTHQFYFDFDSFNLRNLSGATAWGSTGTASKEALADSATAVVGSQACVQAILFALVHNLFFRGLIIRNTYRMDKESLITLGFCIKFNGVFETLILNGVNAHADPKSRSAGEGMQAVLDGLADNARLRQLVDLDLANNVSFGDRGAEFLGEFLCEAYQLRNLNLANCGLSHLETARIFGSLSANARHMSSSLAILDLSFATMPADGEAGSEKVVAALSKLLSLRFLRMRGCFRDAKRTLLGQVLDALAVDPLELEMPTTTVTRCLQQLDLSANAIPAEVVPAWRRFMGQADSLVELNLSECTVEPTFVASVLNNFHSGRLVIRAAGLTNDHMRAISSVNVSRLDLSYNPLNSQGVETLVTKLAFCTSLEQLRLNAVFRATAASAGPGLGALASYLNSESCSVRSLHLSGRDSYVLQNISSERPIESGTTPRAFLAKEDLKSSAVYADEAPLGAALLPLIAALAVNTSLVEVSLCNHRAGPRAAQLLGQTLIRNATIVSLDFDGNDVGELGLRALDYAMQRNLSVRLFPPPAADVGAALAKRAPKKGSVDAYMAADNVRTHAANLQRWALRNAVASGSAVDVLGPLLESLDPFDAQDEDDFSIGMRSSVGGEDARGRVSYNFRYASPTTVSNVRESDALIMQLMGQMGGSALAGGAGGRGGAAPASLPASLLGDTRNYAALTAGATAGGGGALSIRERVFSHRVAVAPPRASDRSGHIFGGALADLVITSDETGTLSLPPFVAGLFASLERFFVREAALVAGMSSNPSPTDSALAALVQDANAGRCPEWATTSASLAGVALVTWLNTLQEPLFGNKVWRALEKAVPSVDDCKAAARRLSPAHLFVASSLFRVLSSILDASSSNGATPEGLATTLGPVLSRRPDEKGRRHDTLVFLLTNRLAIFPGSADRTGLPASMRRTKRSNKKLTMDEEQPQ